jgi:UDP-N-acetylglucosamine diphosphorylase/glucosamine-1-phosphate N-acetyltransferase
MGMNNILLFDNPIWRNQLKPLTLTRPISYLRIGILTIIEKWESYLDCDISSLSETYLQSKYTPKYAEINTYINSSFLPDKNLVEEILGLKENCYLKYENQIVAFKSSLRLDFDFPVESFECVFYPYELQFISRLPDLFLKNVKQIELDFDLVTLNRKSEVLSDKFTIVYNENNIFIEKGAIIKAAILNAENGPIYIGKNAVIQEGSLLIGPVAIGDQAMVAFGAKIRPNTTLGPSCRVGGEVGNTIFQGFSNKAHDGFLGNSYIGEWCNLGANTNNSNLKNDYKSVKLFDFNTQSLQDTGELFCGTFMGDFSKAGISTMFNTGTVIGVSANVFGSGFQDKYIQSFTWGGKMEGYENYRFEKAIEVINATLARKELQLTPNEYQILEYIAQQK